MSVNCERDTQDVRDGLIWFIWFVLFIWLVQFNQTNQTNQTNQINQINQINKRSQPTLASGAPRPANVRCPCANNMACQLYIQILAQYNPGVLHACCRR